MSLWRSIWDWLRSWGPECRTKEATHCDKCGCLRPQYVSAIRRCAGFFGLIVTACCCGEEDPPGGCHECSSFENCYVPDSITATVSLATDLEGTYTICDPATDPNNCEGECVCTEEGAAAYEAFCAAVLESLNGTYTLNWDNGGTWQTDTILADGGCGDGGVPKASGDCGGVIVRDDCKPNAAACSCPDLQLTRYSFGESAFQWSQSEDSTCGNVTLVGTSFRWGSCRLHGNATITFTPDDCEGLP